MASSTKDWHEQLRLMRSKVKAGNLRQHACVTQAMLPEKVSPSITGLPYPAFRIDHGVRIEHEGNTVVRFRR